MSGFLVFNIKSKYYVYILHSEKLKRFYTGSTIDISTRKEFQDNPEARKFIAKAQDWELFESIECGNKSQAPEIERHIKAMKSKSYIQNLKKCPEMKQKLMVKYKS